MAFDLSTAEPVSSAPPRKRFDLTTARPVQPAMEFLRGAGQVPLQALAQATQRATPLDPLGLLPKTVGAVSQVPQSILDIAAPLVGGTLGSRAGLPGISLGAGAGSAFAKSIEKSRRDTGDPLTEDGLSQSVKEVLTAGATSTAGTFVFGGAAQLVGKGIGAIAGRKGLLTASSGRQQRLFQLQKDRLVRGFRQQQAQLTTQRDTAIQSARQQAQAALQTLPESTRARLTALTTEQETVHRTMQEVAEQSVLKVRETFPALAKKTSEEYEALVNTSLQGLEHVDVPFGQLVGAVHRRLGADPETFALALKQLGVSEDLAAVMQKTGVQGVENLGRGFSTTVRDILQRVRKLRGGIAKPARASRQSYTFQDKVLDDTSDALLEVLANQGVKGLEKASAFWAQWAPIRNQAFRDFRPFLQTQTETAAGISRLIRVARGRDPGNVKFIEDMERRLGISLTEDLQGMAQRLTTIQKERLAVKVSQELQTGRIRHIQQQAVEDAKETFLKSLSSVGQTEQTAVSQLERGQFAKRQALQLKAGTVRFGVHIGSVVLLYQMLRRAFDAVLPKFQGTND